MVNEFDMAAAIKSLMTGEARSAPMDAAFITDEFVFLDDARLGAADGPSTAGITESVRVPQQHGKIGVGPGQAPPEASVCGEVVYQLSADRQGLPVGRLRFPRVAHPPE